MLGVTIAVRARERCCRADTGQHDLGSECNQFRRILAQTCGVARAPAIIDPQIAAVAPAQLLKCLQKRRETDL